MENARAVCGVATAGVQSGGIPMADDFISRKAAMEYLYRSINADQNGNCPDCINDEHDCQYDRCWTLMDFCEKIEYIGYVPAADVAPVRHGRWVDTEPNKRDCDYRKNGMAYYCSCCLHRAGKEKHKTYKYCPWCGAKMDGGRA